MYMSEAKKVSKLNYFIRDSALCSASYLKARILTDQVGKYFDIHKGPFYVLIIPVHHL